MDYTIEFQKDYKDKCITTTIIVILVKGQKIPDVFTFIEYESGDYYSIEGRCNLQGICLRKKVEFEKLIESFYEDDTIDDKCWTLIP